MRRNYKIIEFVCLLSCVSTGAFADTCQAGYREISIAATTNDIGGCFDGNFMRYDTPNVNVSDLYYIIPDAPSGSRYTQGSCDSGEYKIPMDLVMGKIGGKCDNSYVQLFISSARNVDIITDSVADYDQGSCPSGFYDATAVTGVSVETLNEGLCDSGYTTYDFEDMCRGLSTSGYTCPLLCESGGEYTELGTCGSYCDAYDENLLHFGDKAARLWSTKQNVKNKSINIMSPTGTVCYVNLVTGEKSGTLNVRYDNATYHVVDLVETGGNE